MDNHHEEQRKPTLAELSNLFAEITIQIKHLDIRRKDLTGKQVAILGEIEKMKAEEYQKIADAVEASVDRMCDKLDKAEEGANNASK